MNAKVEIDDDVAFALLPTQQLEDSFSVTSVISHLLVLLLSFQKFVTSVMFIRIDIKSLAIIVTGYKS